MNIEYDFDRTFRFAKQARDTLYLPGIWVYADEHRKELICRIETIEAEIGAFWLKYENNSSYFDAFRQLLSDWVKIYKEMNRSYMGFRNG